MLEKLFRLTAHGTTVRTEVRAGITTFMTMAYILAVNPGILSATGMEFDAVLTATALSAMVATLVMAFLANLPFALAPGMGINAFFAFTVCIGMGRSWQFALTAVLIEGILFIALTACNVREAIINAIPLPIKHAISGGIGLFIALIGLENAGVVRTGMSAAPDGALTGTLTALGSLQEPVVLVALVGMVVGGALLAAKVRGALLIAILSATIAGIPFGVTTLPDGWQPMGVPPSLSPVFMKFEFGQVLTMDMLVAVATFLFVDLFDSVGTLIGVASRANMLDAEGRVPKARQALFADAIGTTFGAICGTSTVTVYVESAAGVADGGRTGLTALTVAVLFGLSLFFAPVFQVIPAAATAPALVLVGLFMMEPILKVEWKDYAVAIPCFLALIIMPFSYSIADGIAFGIISHVLIKLASGKATELKPVAVLLALIFILKYLLL
ncbi:MAG: NCS2 family permease [Kiritimatiellales bacterium]|nr:NCS2 family permease [Kiritimatiellales bacterium]